MAPLVSRLYSLLRYEHRVDPDENSANGTTNGDTSMNGLLVRRFLHGPGSSTRRIRDKASTPASATSFPDASPNGLKVPAAKLEHAQLDERLKAELRYVGFLGAEDNPDFDAHYDDDIA